MIELSYKLNIKKLLSARTGHRFSLTFETFFTNLTNFVSVLPRKEA